MKVWKEIIVSLFVCLALSAGKGYAQSESMVSSTNDVPLLERMTDGKRKVDWADMNIQFCSAADVSFYNAKLDEAAFKVHRIRLEVLGGFHEKFSYHSSVFESIYDS